MGVPAQLEPTDSPTYVLAANAVGTMLTERKAATREEGMLIFMMMVDLRLGDINERGGQRVQAHKTEQGGQGDRVRTDRGLCERERWDAAR